MYSSIYSSEQKLDQFRFFPSSSPFPPPLVLPTDISFLNVLLCNSARYNSVYSTAAEEIRQSGLWDGQHLRPSYSQDDLPPGAPYAGQGGHGRNPSGLRNELGRRNEYEDSREYLDEYGQKEGGGGGGYEKDSYVSGYQDQQLHERYEDVRYEGGHGQGGGFRPPVQDSSYQYESQGDYQRRY